MPAPLVAAAALKPAGEAVAGVVKVLSTDIVKLEGNVYRRVKARVALTDAQGRVLLTKTGRTRTRTEMRLEPVSVALHANPIGLGVLGAGIAVGAALLFGRLRAGILGIGDIEIYKGPLADEFDAFKARRMAVQAQTCDEYLREYERALAEGRDLDAQAWRFKARRESCAWAG